MSVIFDGKVILVAGNAGVEEAETLLKLVQGNPGAPVDVSGARALHTALWQVLLALSVTVVGEVSDPFIRRWIMPRLPGGKRGNSST